jgi:effector-binding domain-containing protein
MGRQGVAPGGPSICIYYDTELRESDIDVEVAAPVSQAVPEGDRVRQRILPAVETMACVIHDGGSDTIGGTYGSLMSWIQLHGRQIAGPCVRGICADPSRASMQRNI